MSELCTERALSLKYPKTVRDLGVEVLGSSYPDRCLIRCANVCFAGSTDLHLNIGETKAVTCDDHLDYYWKVTYYEYLSEYAVKIIVCKVVEEEEPTPTPPPPVGEVDYERIERETAAIIEASETTITGDISDVGAAVAGNHAAISSMDTKLGTQVNNQTTALSDLIGRVNTELTSQISGQTGALSDLIANTKAGLSGQIGGLTESLTGGLQGLSDKIDGLTFPTLDSIKAAFLDVCADLAQALWDAILDKIEERYPKDEEEAD